MHKRGQLFSFDILFAVIVFILATIAFYFGITTLQEPKQPFAAEQDFIWANLENIVPNSLTGTKINFLKDGYRIDYDITSGEKKLKDFASQTYETTLAAGGPKPDDLKQKILSGFILEESDFCLYFEDDSGRIKIDGSPPPTYGVGSSDITDCDASSQPKCDTYKEALIFTRPVFRVSTPPTGKIIKLNILVCKEPE